MPSGPNSQIYKEHSSSAFLKNDILFKIFHNVKLYFPENTEQIVQQIAFFLFLSNSIQNPPAKEGDSGSIPGSGRSPGE